MFQGNSSRNVLWPGSIRKEEDLKAEREFKKKEEEEEAKKTLNQKKADIETRKKQESEIKDDILRNLKET